MLPVEIQAHIDSIRRRLGQFATSDSDLATLGRYNHGTEYLKCKQQNKDVYEAELDPDLLEAAIANREKVTVQ